MEDYEVEYDRGWVHEKGVKGGRLREMVEVEEVGFEGGMLNCSYQDENVAISRSMRRLHAIFFKY